MQSVRLLIRYAAALLAAAVLATHSVEGRPAAEPGSRGAAAAQACRVVPECPAFNEVFLNTPPLRHGLADAFRHEKLTPPGWLGEPAATTPMIPLEIDGKAYLVGKTGEPGKPSHQVAALYDPVKGWVTATYIDPEGKQAWLGDGQERLRKVLADYLNTSTPLSKAASDAGTALPVRLY